MTGHHDPVIPALPVQHFTDPLLPDGYTWRRFMPGDLQIAVDLMNACDLHFAGFPQTTIAQAQNELLDESVDSENGSWAVFTSDDLLVGLLLALDPNGNADMDLDWYVHPEHVTQGIGLFLVTRGMEHLRTLATSYPAEQPKQVHGTTYAIDKDGKAVYEQFGFAHVRSYYRMEIAFDAPPQVTPIPDGIRIRVVDPAVDMPVIHAVVTETFNEHWGFVPVSYEEYHRTRIENNYFRLDLSLVAEDETTSQIIGGVMCRIVDTTNEGWVNSLSTLKLYRGKGLGRALLTRAFASFYAIGLRTAALGVDASNTTGATELYRSVGMHVGSQYDTFELVL